MNSEDFRKRYYENIIYNELKEKLELNTMAQLRYWLKNSEYNGKVDEQRLYIKLTNYRIKKYGTSVFEVPVKRNEVHRYELNDYTEKRCKRKWNHL